MGRSVTVRVKFTTDADDHTTLMSRERAVEWLRSRGLSELHEADGSVTRIEHVNDEGLVRAVATAAADWIDSEKFEWVRFSEAGTDESAVSPSFAAVRRETIRSVRVTLEESADDDLVVEDEGEMPPTTYVEFDPGSGWIN